ncbi:MAG: hypothetical protein WDO74_31595 [Pseudomonadota bacterium]
MLARLPEDPALDSKEQAAERLMANLLDWHWRESKQTWWEYFRALELPPAERVEDRSSARGSRVRLGDRYREEVERLPLRVP